MKNTFKIKKNENGARGSLFGRVEELLRKLGVPVDSIPVNLIRYTLFVALFGVFYIWNNHYAEKTTRKINKLKVEIQDLKTDFITQKADYMYASKQSEVAKKLKSKGIFESTEPPVKIVVEKGEY